MLHHLQKAYKGYELQFKLKNILKIKKIINGHINYRYYKN